MSSTTEQHDSEDVVETFESLGVVESLCAATTRLGWRKPTPVQVAALPHALAGRDLIALAETGSGKTAAFAIPILQALLETPRRVFALVLTPTRELAFQISEQFDALGAGIGVKTCVVVGGVDMMAQSIALARKPHVIVATPGRLTDHLQNTKGFSLTSLRYLVLDEADRILDMDFGSDLDKILGAVPRQRHTFLFSATMTRKVVKLQRASLVEPVRVDVSSRFQTVATLKQYYMFIPCRYKDVYLVHVVNELAGHSFMIFCSTCQNVMRVALLLRSLGLPAVPLHGQMGQNKRLGALNKFKSKNGGILVATDVASRGLDIPHVDVVINMDMPTRSKDYIHRVGRTARAGRGGKAVTLVTQYDVELYQRIEHLLGKKLPLYESDESEVMVLMERVCEAQRVAKMELREMEEKKKGGKRKRGGDDGDDDTEEVGPKKVGKLVKNRKQKFKK